MPVPTRTATEGDTSIVVDNAWMEAAAAEGVDAAAGAGTNSRAETRMDSDVGAAGGASAGVGTGVGAGGVMDEDGDDDSDSVDAYTDAEPAVPGLGFLAWMEEFGRRLSDGVYAYVGEDVTGGQGGVEPVQCKQPCFVFRVLWHESTFFRGLEGGLGGAALLDF
jgi:hypothetical protein